MAAATFGHASSTANNTSATSRTWAHDCTGDNYLTVSVNHRNNPGTSSATYNGTSMTLLQLQTATFNWQNFYGLASPASGSNNIVASWTNSVKVGAIGISASEVSSVGSVITASVAGASGNFSTSATTLTANDMLIGACGMPDYDTNVSVVTGTERAESPSASPNDTVTNGATNTGVGSVLITWNYVNSDPKTYVALPMYGSASVTVTPDLRTYFY